MNKINSIATKTAQILIKINAVSFRYNPPFIFTTGIKSPIYLDNRIVMSYPRERKQIVNYYIEILKNKVGLKNINCISATASAAIPHGAWIAEKLDLPMIYVRPTTKTYGKGNKIEGYFPKKSKIVIIEDHISTATSVAGNAQAIRELGGTVKYCIATTTYETTLSKKILSENKVELFALTTGKIIVEQAYQMKIINDNEKKQVDEWFQNPQKWSP